METQEVVHQPDPRRWLMLGVVLSAALVVVLDTFIVNVALPSIQRSLHANFAVMQLVVAGYTLVCASCTASCLNSAVKVGCGFGMILTFLQEHCLPTCYHSTKPGEDQVPFAQKGREAG